MATANNSFIVPVIDIREGRAVRGIGGARRSYQSVLSVHPPGLDSDTPLAVARWYRARYDANDLYVADLDAIEACSPKLENLEPLLADGFRIYADAAWSSASPDGLAELLAQESRWSERLTKIYSSETMESPERLEQLFSTQSKSDSYSSSLLSIDLYRGKAWCGEQVLLGDSLVDERSAAGEGNTEVLAWVQTAMRVGIRRILLLDLADVGGGQGISTLKILSRLASEFSGIEWWVGGGVRSRDDVRRARAAGASRVLMASALLSGQWPAGGVPLNEVT